MNRNFFLLSRFQNLTRFFSGIVSGGSGGRQFQNLRVLKLPLFIFLIFSLGGVLQAQRVFFRDDLDYDPFFSLVLTDAEGNQYHLQNVRFVAGEEDRFFFWIRRGTDAGIATYALDFNRISSIDFTGDYDDPVDDYTPGRLTLVNGESYDVFINTKGYLAGNDSDFGSFVRILLDYNLVNSIQFIHDGSYKICPFCGTLYYDTDQEVCPFDKTPLLEQSFPELNTDYPSTSSGSGG